MARFDLVPQNEIPASPTRWSQVRTSYFFDRIIDIAEVVAQKGSPLVVDDEIRILRIPGNTWVDGVCILQVGAPDNATARFNVSIDWPTGSSEGRLDVISDWNPTDLWYTNHAGQYTTGGSGPAKFDEWITVRISAITGTLSQGKIQVGFHGTEITPLAKPDSAHVGS